MRTLSFIVAAAVAGLLMFQQAEAVNLRTERRDRGASNPVYNGELQNLGAMVKPSTEGKYFRASKRILGLDQEPHGSRSNGGKGYQPGVQDV